MTSTGGQRMSKSKLYIVEASMLPEVFIKVSEAKEYLETGKAEYILLDDMNARIDYLRASASLPYFSIISTQSFEPHLLL